MFKIITLNLLFLSFFRVLPCFSNDLPGENKLYITTNNEQYQTGETIGFNAILLAPTTNPQQAVFSELYDCKGNRLTKKVFPLVNRMASGSLDIPANSREDYYLLYCYTLNLQGGIEFDFLKKIYSLASPAKETAQTSTWTSNDLSLEVFIEGNQFVSQLPNTLLIRTFDNKKKPVSVEANIINQKEEIAGVFKTNEQGYALIRFNPEEKGSYYIAVEDIAGNEKKVQLPKPSPNGINLRANFKDGYFHYTVNSNTSNIQQPLQYNVHITSKTDTVYEANLSFQQGISEVSEKIKTAELPEGYLQLQISEKGKRILDRLLYNQPGPATNHRIKIIDTVNHREAIVEIPGHINGKGYLQISGDASKTIEASASLPALMPTLGVLDKTTIEFNDQLIGLPLPAGETSKSAPVKEYMPLAGTILTRENEPLKKQAVNIIVVQKNLKKQFFVAKTDAMGKLKIEALPFYDSARIYYQLADKSEGRNNLIFQPDPVSMLLGAKENSRAGFDCADLTSRNPNSDQKSDDKTLQQVIVKGQAVKTDAEKFEEQHVAPQLTKKSGTRNEFDFIKNPQAVDNTALFDFIKGRFAGLIIKVLMDGTPRITTSYLAPVGVYLNDMEIQPTDLNILAGLQLKDIAQVKYIPTSFRPKQISGNPFLDLKAQDGGDLVIYTKKEFMGSETGMQGLPSIKLPGYDVTKPTHNSIYWNPQHSLEKDEQIYIGSADKNPGLQLKLEGLTKNLVPYSFSTPLIFR